ncbi:MAG: hypothetical protein Q7K20_10265 [Polaromonas sp.]|nr:hypothetical protein [Polaromonas sp.]
MFKTTKKLAVASAVAMMFAGSAHAINFDDLITSVDSTVAGITTVTYTGVPVTTDSFLNVTTGLAALTAGTTAPVISVVGGAINTAVINGAIDISGANVSFGSVAANVAATATAVGTTASSEAYAIAGAKLSTTVIGAMNSSTLDVMGSTTTLSDKLATQLGVSTLASSGGTTTMATPAYTGAGLLGSLATANILSSGTDINLAGLTSSTDLTSTSLVNELQAMRVFNGAVNVASLDAGIKIAANVDTNAWFLNPQTGVVNLSNIAMTTTAIGAMNSSITRLGANLAK